MHRQSQRSAGTKTLALSSCTHTDGLCPSHRFLFCQNHQQVIIIVTVLSKLQVSVKRFIYFLFSRTKRRNTEGNTKRTSMRCIVLITAKDKKKRGNYFQNKQLPFASQLSNNKSQKWLVVEYLNTHINHKNGYTAPWQCIATVQNFSQGERRQKNTLLLLTPASHFGLQRF